MATITDDVVRDIEKGTLDDPALQRYFRDGLDIDERDSNGLPPICVAARGGKLAIVQILLNNDADPNALDKNNRSAISYAKASSHNLRTEIIKILSAKGGKDSAGDVPIGGSQPGSGGGQPGAGGGQTNEPKPPGPRPNGRDPATYFDPPARLDDLPVGSQERKDWSTTMNSIMDKIAQPKKGRPQRVPRFYNPINSGTAAGINILWKAFPNRLPSRFKKADERGEQDEYCEWEVKKDPNGELLCATFTTETPEYFNHLSTIRDGTLLVDTYNRCLFGKDRSKYQVRKEDLFGADGKYNPRNKWNCPGSSNTGHIIHMVRDNNTLEEAADLVAESSIIVEGKTDAIELLTLVGVSEDSPYRSSDPLIVDKVNTLARAGNYISMRNPLGLYIHSFIGRAIAGPVNEPPVTGNNLWKVERQSEDGRYIVRAKFEVPDNLVGKLMVDGQKLRYGSQIAQHIWVAANVLYTADPKSDSILPDISTPSGGSEPIFTFIEGRHVQPIQVPAETVTRELQLEYFGRFLSQTKEDQRPTQLSTLIDSLPDYTWIAYAAHEAIGIQVKGPTGTTRFEGDENTRVRLVIMCTPYNPSKPPYPTNSKMAHVTDEYRDKVVFKVPTLAIVFAAPSSDPSNIESEKSILQCASFSPELGWFNFYDRERVFEGKKGRWLYFGNSKDAYTPDTHGLGPFCGHANGGMIMKELDDPWVHWHSQTLPLILSPKHQMYKNRRFRDINKQEQGWYFGRPHDLAEMVKDGTRKWYDTRLTLDLGPTNALFPIAQRVNQWIAHLLMPTSLSIACSKPAGRGNFKIPQGFFLNSRCLNGVVLGVIELENDIDDVPNQLYLDGLAKLSLATIEKFRPRGKNAILVSSEGQQPWKVILPSFDDGLGMKLIIRSGLLPPRVICAMLMVDFCNPVFSARRARLMRYIPSTAIYNPSTPDDKYGLGAGLLYAIKTAMTSLELDEKSPEAEYLKLVQDDNWQKTTLATIEKYVQEINNNLKTAEGILNYMRVAETNRRMFRPPPVTRRPVHPLAEFDLSLPHAEPAKMRYSETWQMSPDGTAKQYLTEESIWHPRNTQAHLSSAGCPFSAGF